MKPIRASLHVLVHFPSLFGPDLFNLLLFTVVVPTTGKHIYLCRFFYTFGKQVLKKQVSSSL